MIKTAVIILNWNGAKLLQQFLPSVLKTTNIPQSKVIVADNASSDNSLSVLSEEFPEVKVLAFDKNYGFAGGYNKAIAQVDAEYIVLLNSDVETTDNWLLPLQRFMDNTLSAGACGPKILDYKNKALFEYAGASGGFLDRFGFPFCRGRIFDTLEPDNGQYNHEMEVLWASGACLMVRKKVYEQLGGLDEFFFAHQEEIDLCWRMHHENIKVFCIPSSHVYHVGGASLAVGSPNKTYLNFRNSLYLIYKNEVYSSFIWLYMVRLKLDSIAALKFALSDGFEHVKAVWRAHKDFHKHKAQYKAKRKTLLTMRKKRPNQIIKQSIVYLYYVKRKTIFASLKNLND